MPYKFETDKLKVPREKDRRVKLSFEDRETIKELYKSEEYSQRKLANMFGVSRRLIQFYTDDKKLENNKSLYKERRKDGRYYDTEKNNEYMNRHRRNKKELYDRGELT